MLKAFCNREQILLAAIDNHMQNYLSSKLLREQVWKHDGATDSCPAAPRGLTAPGSHRLVLPLQPHNPKDPMQTAGVRRNLSRKTLSPAGAPPPRPSTRRALAEERGTAETRQAGPGKGVGCGRGGERGRSGGRLPW